MTKFANNEELGRNRCGVLALGLKHRHEVEPGSELEEVVRILERIAAGENLDDVLFGGKSFRQEQVGAAIVATVDARVQYRGKSKAQVFKDLAQETGDAWTTIRERYYSNRRRQKE